MSIKQIKSLVQFTRASSLVWQAMTIPIPDGVVTFSIDDGAFKIGDGISLYNALPTLFTYENLLAAQGGVSTLFKTILPADDGKLAIVYFDELLGKVKYAPSTTSLTDILTTISTLEASDAAQTTVIATLLSLALSIDIGINTAPDGSIVVINNGRFSNSGTTVAALSAQVIAGAPYIPGSRLEDPVLYINQSKQLKADKNALLDGNTYYIEVIGYNNDVITPVYNVECANTNVVITNVAGPLFSVRFNNVTGAGKMDTPVILVVSVDDGTGNRLVKKAVTCNIQYNRIIVAIYGGAGTDLFSFAVTDSKDNTICIGYTTSEGAGGEDALVVKYDSAFNIIARKRYGGTGAERLRSVKVDSNDNIIVAGHVGSEGTGSFCGLVIKFDKLLNIITRKIYNGSSSIQFNGVAIDSNGNVICIGRTTGGGAGADDCSIVKFDSNLNLIAHKFLGSNVYDSFQDVTVDKNNNIIAVGQTNTLTNTAGGYDGLVVKFDTNLNILVQKSYGGNVDEMFSRVVTDSQNNILICGRTTSESLTGTTINDDALVIKFDNNLNILAHKRYGGGGVDAFYGINVDLNDNIICVGQTNSEGPGSNYAALIVKFDKDLNIVFKKIYGGTGTESLNGVTVDSQNNIICCGRTSTEGLGNEDTMIVKLPPVAPSGTFTGSILTGLILSDSNLTLVNSNLILNTSQLTVNSSTFTVANSNLTLADSNLTLEKDTIN